MLRKPKACAEDIALAMELYYGLGIDWLTIREQMGWEIAPYGKPYQIKRAEEMGFAGYPLKLSTIDNYTSIHMPSTTHKSN